MDRKTFDSYENGIGKHKSAWNAPCVATFEESTSLGRENLAIVRTRISLTFYHGRGKVSQVRLADPPEDLGLPMLKSILESQAALEANCPDIFPFEHTCPGKMPDGSACGGKFFSVVLDRRLDGFALLKLTCEKCKAVITQDVKTLDTRLLCAGCGIARPDVRTADDPATGEKMRLCDSCYGTRKPKTDERKEER